MHVLHAHNREFKQITTAGATTAAVTEKVWGEYVSVVCQKLAIAKYKDVRNTSLKVYNLFYLLSHSQMASLKERRPFPCRNGVYFKYSFSKYALPKKKVQLKYTSFILTEEKYKIK